MKRALVTGGSGFVGRWLCAALVRDGWDVTATATFIPGVIELGVDAPWGSLEDVAWIAGDVRDGAHLRDAIAQAKPDAIVHLAAISHVQQATDSQELAWDVNVRAPVRLLQEISAQRAEGAIDPRVLLVGSAEQYGRQPSALMPLVESTEQRPLTVYGATKAAQEIAGLQSFRAEGLQVVCVRPFPHSGPGQEPRFVIPALVRRAMGLKAANTGAPMTLGNTSPIRDFLHVSDVVDAYIALIGKGQSGTAYNVASGVGRTVREVAERVLARVGVAAPLFEDPALVRAVDVPALVGDATRLTADTGWRPKRAFDDILDDLLYDLQKHAATI
jgi:GDP-4-dehydro-6-deoxy-D-mannose reductase